MSREIRSRRFASRVSAVLLAAAAPALAVDKSFLVANGVWGTAGNWNPLGAPTVADNAHIGNTAGAINGIVSIGAPASAANLFISDGMTLRTQLFTPTISSHTSILGFNAPGGDLFRSRLMVDDGSGVIDFQTNTLTVDDGGQVELAGGRVRVNGLFDLNTASLFSGSGTLDLHSNAAGPAMIVNGLVTPVGDMRIHQNGTAAIDLDGTLEADRVINVTGTLGMSYSAFVLRGTHLYDAFGDTFQIGRGNVVNLDLDDGFTLSPAGVINFQHQAGRNELALLTGGTMTVNGDIIVDANGGAIVNTPVIMQPSSMVQVGNNASLTINQEATINGGVYNVGDNADLGFNSPLTISSGTFNVSSTNGSVDFTGATTYSGNPHFSGLVRQVGDATVSSATTITAETFDMDGVASTDWTINAPLTINADSIDTSSSIFNNTMTVNVLNPFNPSYVDIDVQTLGGWMMMGTLNLNGPGGEVVMSNTVRGDELNLTGTINVSGGNAMTATLDVLAGGVVNINDGGGLRLDGGDIASPNTMSGGHILGEGRLRASAGHALRGYGTISSSVYFADDSELRASNGVLTIDGPVFDVGVIGTANDTGILELVGPFNGSVADRIELLGGQVRGGMLFNGNLTTGRGLITSDSMYNEGSISAVGGELIINTANNSLDLDGLGETGRLFVDQGNLTISDLPTDSFSGQAYVGAGRTLNMNAGWLLGSAGTIQLTGSVGNPATVTSGGGNAQTLLGATVVNGNGVYDLYTGFNSSSRVFTAAAGDTLTVTRGGFVAEGATFSGPGSLVNASTGSLLLDADSTIGMRLVNQGLLRIESDVATGIANTQRFAQSASGTTRIELGGTTPGAQFDRLEVTQDAHLSGALELSTLGFYVPAFLQTHEIMRADSVSGFFSTVSNNKIAADKYWAVTYDADSVFATAALPGDANLDGSVNISDFAILASQFNTAGPWMEGNFNGDATADINDFALLAANFNVSVAAELPRGAAVPEPTSLFCAVAPLALLGKRKRRQA